MDECRNAGVTNWKSKSLFQSNLFTIRVTASLSQQLHFRDCDICNDMTQIFEKHLVAWHVLRVPVLISTTSHTLPHCDSYACHHEQ